MAIRVGFLGVAHVHCPSYAHLLKVREDATISGVFDREPERAGAFSARFEALTFDSIERLLQASDAVIIGSETAFHVELAEAAAAAGRPIFCEKPLVVSQEQADRLMNACADKAFMTAFPCPYAPSWNRVVQRLQAGEIGELLTACTTNHGRNPGGWFNDPALAGGGAIMDHTVHVADLLFRVFKEEPIQVTAAAGPEGLETRAMLTADYRQGRFATLDASWSRPAEYKTWGDVTLNLVGTEGVIEVDLFSQSIDVYHSNHTVAGFGANLDRLMLKEFVAMILDGKPPLTTLEDGLRANRFALTALASFQQGGEPVALPGSVAIG